MSVLLRDLKNWLDLYFVLLYFAYLCFLNSCLVKIVFVIILVIIETFIHTSLEHGWSSRPKQVFRITTQLSGHLLRPYQNAGQFDLMLASSLSTFRH